FLADTGPVETHVAFHHLIDPRNVMWNPEWARQHAVGATDATRFHRAMHDSVFILLNRVRGTHFRARGVFAVHTNNRTRLRRYCAIDKFEVDHGLAAVRVTLHACLNA